MKLQDLIPYLENTTSLERLYSEVSFGRDDINLLIYMEDKLDVGSDVYLYSEEETNDLIVFLKDGKRYIQLFPVEFAVYLIEFDLDLKDKGLSDLEIAEQLVKYALLDG